MIVAETGAFMKLQSLSDHISEHLCQAVPDIIKYVENCRQNNFISLLNGGLVDLQVTVLISKRYNIICNLLPIRSGRFGRFYNLLSLSSFMVANN